MGRTTPKAAAKAVKTSESMPAQLVSRRSASSTGCRSAICVVVTMKAITAASSPRVPSVSDLTLPISDLARSSTCGDGLVQPLLERVGNLRRGLVQAAADGGCLAVQRDVRPDPVVLDHPHRIPRLLRVLQVQGALDGGEGEGEVPQQTGELGVYGTEARAFGVRLDGTLHPARRRGEILLSGLTPAPGVLRQDAGVMGDQRQIPRVGGQRRLRVAQRGHQVGPGLFQHRHVGVQDGAHRHAVEACRVPLVQPPEAAGVQGAPVPGQQDVQRVEATRGVGRVGDAPFQGVHLRG